MRRGKVEITPGFLLLAAWLNLLDRQMIFPLAMAACLIHEMGHLAVLAAWGKEIRRIRITAAGAEIRTTGEMSYGTELLAILAGPAVNLLAALFLCRIPGGETAAGLNLTLAAFNLLPCRNLDGGRALSCLLHMTLGAGRGELVFDIICRTLSTAFGAAGFFLAVFAENLTLMLVSVWLIISERESREVRKRNSFKYWKKVRKRQN